MKRAGIFALWAVEAIQSRAVYPDERFPPSLYYRYLKLLTTKRKPKLSVELGCGDCGGSLHLAWGHGGGRVIGVDLERRENVAFVEKHFKNFKFMQGDSIELAGRIHREHGEIDTLFIDTVHTYERTMAEFNAYKPHLAHDAVVCLDDLFRPGMERAWAELPGKKVRLDLLHIGDYDGQSGDGGFGVVYEID